jgi:hypothetical protein
LPGVEGIAADMLYEEAVSMVPVTEKLVTAANSAILEVVLLALYI